MISVNPHALEEARKDDQLRAEGDTAPLLGIPIAAKDIYDTTEMPTTGGSLVFENYVPEKNSFIVQQLIEAGAIIIGKANLSEFANSGYYSASAYGQVWNAFDPSKSSIGSSGGSAVAVATNMAAAALGTQTGDSLWGPSSAASLVSLRGTDGLTTCQGVMPLTYIQDYCGVITRTTEDQALVLDAIATRDPEEATQGLEGAGWEGKRPTDWSSYLKADALEGKTIGWYDREFTSPWGDVGTTSAMKEEFKYFEAAGATVKEIGTLRRPPEKADFAITGDTGYEGWLKWIQDHPNSPYKSPPEITNSQLRIPQLRSASTTYTGAGAMSDRIDRRIRQLPTGLPGAVGRLDESRRGRRGPLRGRALDDPSERLERIELRSGNAAPGPGSIRRPRTPACRRRSSRLASARSGSPTTSSCRDRRTPIPNCWGWRTRSRTVRPRPPGDESCPGAEVRRRRRGHAAGRSADLAGIDDDAPGRLGLGDGAGSSSSSTSTPTTGRPTPTTTRPRRRPPTWTAPSSSPAASWWRRSPAPAPPAPAR